jgi:hypothetical protein
LAIVIGQDPINAGQLLADDGGAFGASGLELDQRNPLS